MKKISLIPALLAFGILLNGCSDILDEKQPLGSRNEAVFYKTEQDAYEAVVAIYDALQPTSAHQVTADVLSDDGYAGGSSRSDIPEQIQMDQHDILPTNFYAQEIWNFNYTGIYRANLLLEKLPEIEGDTGVLMRFEGEARFLRAYFYWNLVRFFQNVPLITKTLSPEEYAQPQADPDEIFKLIFSDLERAAALLPSEATFDGRATAWAAKSLLARAFLFQNGVYGNDLTTENGTTVNATYATVQIDDVIANSGHDLEEDVAVLFTRAGEQSIESVFEIGYSDLGKYGNWDNPYGGEGSFPVVWQGPRVKDVAIENYFRGWSFNTVSLDLFESFEDGDPRKDAYILEETDLNGSVTKGFTHTGYYTNKYTTKKEYQATDGSPELNYGNNYKVIRFADVLLMGAELHLLSGGSRAQEYLDRVRDRVGLESVPATLDNIYQERRVELCMEGLRYHDLLRRGLSYAENEISVQGEIGPLYDFKESDEIDFDVTFNTATKGYLPIPQLEIDLLQGALVQNEGY